MSGSSEKDDGMADAIAATTIITIVVVALCIWLAAMPG